MDKIKVVIVDDDPLVLKSIKRIFKKERFDITEFNDPHEALDAFKNAYFDVLISDYMMPGMTGIELVRHFKSLQKTSEAIMVTGVTEFSIAVSAVNEGILFKFVTKPFEANTLSTYVKDAYRLVQENSVYHRFKDWSLNVLTENKSDDVVVALQKNAVEGLMNLMKAKDLDLYEHSKRIGALCLRFGNFLGYAPDMLENLYDGGVLHDIGKLAIKDQILDKPGALDELEFSEIKRHPAVGAELVRKLGVNEHIQRYIRQHHERVDGTGYPDALPNEAIEPAAKIIAIIDAYDALSSKRAYKDAFDGAEVKRILYNMADTVFDKDLLDRFFMMIENWTHLSDLEDIKR